MSESSHYISKYQQLLRDLKSTVEGLLMTQVANVWSVYGGLNRFHTIVDKIFRHGSKGSEEVSFNFIRYQVTFSLRNGGYIFILSDIK